MNRAYQLFSKLISILRKINGNILIILSFSLVICVVWQVISRYIAPRPSTTTDEMARFIFMWIGLLGAAQASAYKKHLAIDLLILKLKGKAQKILQGIIEILILIFATSVLIYGGTLLSIRTFSNAQITPALQIPMGYVYLVVPIAGTLIAFFSLFEIFRLLQNDHDHQ